MDNQVLPSKTKSRTKMIALFMVFFGPIFFAMFLYANLDIWRPANTMNHGELILPTAPLHYFELIEWASGKPISLETIKGKWNLIYVGKGECGADCQANLIKVRQLRILLGRELARVQYLFLALDESAEKSVSRLVAEHPRMTRAHVLHGMGHKQLSAFGDGAVGCFFLIDPLGNLVLRYKKDFEGKGMLKDIHRLLKISKIG
jgi:cytochrome oxidase Cu insertion factor (SCO1/SenC/PrrC family)